MFSLYFLIPVGQYFYVLKLEVQSVATAISSQELGIPQNWAIKGFRQIPPSEIGGRARQDCRCFAGAQIGLDRT